MNKKIQANQTAKASQGAKWPKQANREQDFKMTKMKTTIQQDRWDWWLWKCLRNHRLPFCHLSAAQAMTHSVEKSHLRQKPTFHFNSQNYQNYTQILEKKNNINPTCIVSMLENWRNSREDGEWIVSDQNLSSSQFHTVPHFCSAQIHTSTVFTFCSTLCGRHTSPHFKTSPLDSLTPALLLAAALTQENFALFGSIKFWPQHRCLLFFFSLHFFQGSVGRWVVVNTEKDWRCAS